MSRFFKHVKSYKSKLQRPLKPTILRSVEGGGQKQDQIFTDSINKLKDNIYNDKMSPMRKAFNAYCAFNGTVGAGMLSMLMLSEVPPPANILMLPITIGIGGISGIIGGPILQLSYLIQR